MKTDYISLYRLNEPKTERCFSYPDLTGGLNLYDPEYRLKAGESPECENLMRRDGVLNCRDGQIWACTDEGGAPRAMGTGYAIYGRLFRGYHVIHCGTRLLCRKADSEASTPFTVLLSSGVPENKGSFTEYFGALLYKNRGGYFSVTYDSLSGELAAAAVEPYIPTILINADPSDGSGDLYQRDNRLSSHSRILYNGDGATVVYTLPCAAQAIKEIKVGGAETSAYSFADNTVTFTDAPEQGENNVEIVITAPDSTLYNSVMSCRYITSFGGAGSVSLVLGGCESRPNAYFWNANDSLAMNPGYFPADSYQLAGDSSDPVTGFGKQQSSLVIFKACSVGKTAFETTELDGLTVIDLPYTPINAETGCDLPGSIRLIENNLVWCNTEGGAFRLKDSSWANENSIAGFSRKVNGSGEVKGLLKALSAGPDKVCSCDDGRRWWIANGEDVWVWDYELSDPGSPAWFRFTGIGAVGFCREGDRLWHLDSAGRLTIFKRCFADYGEPIRKVYRFAAQYFGGYDKLKNVDSVVLVMRSDTNAVVSLTYISDWERRRDGTDLHALSWVLAPRNLAFRNLSGRGFAQVFRRRAMCRKVRHFTMRLENNRTGEDLSVVSAQIFYNHQGRQR